MVEKKSSAGFESLTYVLLAGILLLAAFLRFRGSDWAVNSMLHPDERFYSDVTYRLQPLANWADYFNTATSTLNPEVQGFGFFVYGTLPIFITKATGALLNGGNALWMTDYIRYGRLLSAVFDLLTILLVFLMGRKLFDWRVGLLAAVFSTFAVLQIQQSHFYTSDAFSTTFVFLALYFSACMFQEPASDEDPAAFKKYIKKLVLYSFGFGVATGLAMSCKVNTALVSVFLPLTWLIVYLKSTPEIKSKLGIDALLGVVVGGMAALLAFRVFQPYAFTGPGFFGLSLNQGWLDDLKSLAGQMSGDIDTPPALQWARRGKTFLLENMVIWGLGLPLGLSALAGMVWMGFSQIKGLWKTSLVLWLWTVMYLIWQSSQGNPTMRYALPIYPSMALLAAWMIIQLWELGKERTARILQSLSIAIGIVVLVVTGAWALAFSGIYDRPITRVAASEWIYQHVPGPVQLTFTTADGDYNQNLSFGWTEGQRHRVSSFITPSRPVVFRFTADHTGTVTSFLASYIEITKGNIEGNDPLPTSARLDVRLKDLDSGTEANAQLEDVFKPSDSYLQWKIDFPESIQIQQGKRYEITLQSDIQLAELNVRGPLELLLDHDGKISHQTLPTLQNYFDESNPATYRFSIEKIGTLNSINLNLLGITPKATQDPSIRFSLIDIKNPAQTLFEKTISPAELESEASKHGDQFVLKPDIPIRLDLSTTYEFKIEMLGAGTGYLEGTTTTNETDWDDGLPLRLDRYDPYGSFYIPGVVLQMYWPDEESKRERMLSILERSDYLFISSNRQWGTTVRVPERYPLATEYYRALMGCPENQDILYCYRTGLVGSDKGKLGFELVYTANSNPIIGPIEINDQFAEEAFTVYDHPKVLIFRKTAEYDSEKVREILGGVDLTHVVNIPAMRIQSAPSSLMLPDEMVKQQSTSGTWSDLFDVNASWNQNPWFAALIWYLAFLILGWLIYPTIRIVMKGLPAKGYAFARLTGLIVLTWVVWMGSSNGIPFDRLWIAAAIGIIALVNLVLFILRAKEIRAELRSSWRDYLAVEIVTLVLFVLWSLVRYMNPDLWHPWKGGEKPMDFAYLNAVIKSVQFPPYNPWYSGAWINYYYYGFVLAAVPIKLLGILPSIGYNLVEATFFTLTGISAYGLGTAIYKSFHSESSPGKLPNWVAGVVSAIAVLIIGNLGNVKLIWEGFQKLAAPNGQISDVTLLQKLTWFIQGIGAYAQGSKLPIPTDWWYWNASRAIEGGNEITEFPFFTFLYADPHAHMFALGITVLALAWIFVIAIINWEEKHWAVILLQLFIGGLIIGSLNPTNSWDSPTYRLIASVALTYSGLRTGYRLWSKEPASPGWMLRIPFTAVLVLGFNLFVKLLYQPFTHWFAQAYTKFDLWTGNHTTLNQFFIHWGIFLVIIAGWLIVELFDWLDRTPARSLQKLKPFRGAIIFFVIFALGLLFGLTVFAKIPTAIISLPLGFLALVLLFRKDQQDAKRFILFIIGCGAMLVFMVEVIVLVGDISRMNTVFKLYMQVWVLWGISAAAAFVWMMQRFEKTEAPIVFRWWRVAAIVLIAGGLLYPATATSAKMRDRMAENAPKTLDGMTYMMVAHQNENGVDFALRDDYDLIRWMQDNIKGTPVILEGNLPLYHWGNRISIYTGLPVPIGWDWHERQQRMTLPETDLKQRMQDTADFYTLPDIVTARQILQKYDIRFFVIGDAEKIYYPQEGLAKFESADGTYWKKVYSGGNAALYEVLP